MTLRNAKPIKFSPKGLSDTLDSSDSFPGACATLQNLIPDPTTLNVWTPRPAAVELTTFTGFSTPGVISCLKVVGTRVYGLIASARNSGKDEPFSYNIVTNAFDTIANVTSSNVPTTQSTTGDWVPPTMDLMGTLLVVTHPGFDGSSHFFGWFDITVPSAPRWHAGNLLQNGSITALGAITAGSGYVAGTYLNVPLTGGTGSGATADIVVAAGGGVSTVTLDTWGNGYLATDSLSASNANLGGSGSGFAVAVSTVATTVSGRLQFLTIPAWVRQFNQRCYFGINPTTSQPSVLFTDVLVLGCSNAGQALTFSDNLPLVAGQPLGLSTQLGGIVQSMMVFKGESNIAQVTGDYAYQTLSVNTLNVATGTTSPVGIASSPYGVLFIAPDGMRLIDFNAKVSDPIGAAGSGVVVPLISALYPTRVVMACNGEVVRISLQNSAAAGSPWQEYWYDLVRKIWSGPHTFPATNIDVYQGTFIISPQAVTASLWQSTVIPNSSSSYTENGAVLAWEFETSVLPDLGQLAASELIELSVKAGVPPGSATFNIIALDQNGAVLQQTSRSVPGSSGSSAWGHSDWGYADWGSGGTSSLTPYRIDFPGPVIYDRLAIQINGVAAINQRLGDLYMRQRSLGYKGDVINGPG